MVAMKHYDHSITRRTMTEADKRLQERGERKVLELSGLGAIVKAVQAFEDDLARQGWVKGFDGVWRIPLKPLHGTTEEVAHD